MDNLPDDIASLRALAAAALARVDILEANAVQTATELAQAVAEAARAQAIKSGDEALIATLKLEILKLRRELYGVRSERKSRLLDQLELQLEDLEANAGEDELKAEQAAAKTTNVHPFTRNKPVRSKHPQSTAVRRIPSAGGLPTAPTPRRGT